MRSLLLLLPLLAFAADTTVKKSPTPVKKPAAVAAAKNYKESGSPTAPLTMEIYTDYQCPSCRAFYMDEMPLLAKDYVKTGKVRILHRDFPLPMHQFGALAAKYANAAGQVGLYELVLNQIFKTQPEWSQNGNVDIQVAKVVPPGDMQKMREIVKNDPRLEDTVRADVNMGNQDRINSTPTFVFVGRNGRRQVVSGPMEYSLMKAYIDQLLAKG